MDHSSLEYHEHISVLALIRCFVGVQGRASDASGVRGAPDATLRDVQDDGTPQRFKSCDMEDALSDRS
jgi:hypothetical protein